MHETGVATSKIGMDFREIWKVKPKELAVQYLIREEKRFRVICCQLIWTTKCKTVAFPSFSRKDRAVLWEVRGRKGHTEYGAFRAQTDSLLARNLEKKSRKEQTLGRHQHTGGS